MNLKMSSLKKINIYVAISAYVYTDETGQNLETHLTTQFLAKRNLEAIKKAVAHAHERYENYFKDTYKNCFFGSLKVYTECIGQINSKTGILCPVGTARIFEWKYDWPGTLNHYIKSYKG